MVIAPAISKTVAMRHAVRRVMTFDPTLVPKLFATSLAPIPNDRNSAARKPQASVQGDNNSWSGGKVVAGGVVVELCSSCCRVSMVQQRWCISQMMRRS